MFFDTAKIQKNFTKSKYKLQKVKFNSNLFKIHVHIIYLKKRLYYINDYFCTLIKTGVYFE